MDGGIENPEWVDLKNLLNSWHVGILYELFKEEDIGINELKMMQCSHMNPLLKNYKMGVRIRFEYHFNSWRNRNGIPLKSLEANQYKCCCDCKSTTENNLLENHHITNTTSSTIAAATHSDESKKRRLSHKVEETELDDNQPPLSPQSVNSNNSIVNMFNSNELLNFVPVTVLESPKEKATHNTDDDEAELENIPLNSLCDLLSDSMYETPPKFPSKSTTDKCHVNLKQILQKSGTRGMTILKFFQEKNRLTNVHRSQLIQTIVDYFVENDYHLSLNMSHNLEWEILKMFPTENLEYYRTGKRGKIYVKFSNTKRCKRERVNKVRSELDLQARHIHRSQQLNENNRVNNAAQEEENERTNNRDTKVTVKDENLSENEQNSE